MPNQHIAPLGPLSSSSAFFVSANAAAAKLEHGGPRTTRSEA